MRIFSPAETAAALPYPALIDGLAAMFAAGTTAPLRHHHTMAREGEPDATLLLMPAWSGSHGGVKVATVTPGNAGRGLPAVTASYLLFDALTGAHVALLDGATLTARRTAAASALAARYLAPQDARTLLIVGAGRIGAEAVDAFSAVRPIERVLVCNRTAARGEALTAQLRAAGHEARLVDDLERAVPQADIISCATLSRAPVLHGDWLRPGQHVDLIGAFTPAMREVDDTALRRAALWIDTEAALVEAGELCIPLASGAITERDIRGTLYDLTRDGAPARADDAITLFKSVGAAVEDLAAAMVATGQGGG